MKTKMNNVINAAIAAAEIIVRAAIEKREAINKKLRALNLPETPYVVVEIPLDMIKIDPLYQRALRSQKILTNFKNFNPAKVDIKTANYRPDEGCFYLTDGFHTYNLLKMMGYKSMWVRLFVGLSVAEEAKMFITQNEGCTRVNAAEKFVGGLAAGEEPYTTIKRVCDEYKITIKDSGVKKLDRNISSVQILVRVMKKYGEDGLRFMLDLLDDAKWLDIKGALVQTYLTIGFVAYPYCKRGDDKYVMLTKVMEECAPDEFAGYAKAMFPTMKGKHGEGSIPHYVKYLLDVQ